MGHAQTEGILRTGLSIDYAHLEIHKENSFTFFSGCTAMGDTETLNACWKTPTVGEWHMIIKYDTKVAGHAELLEGPQYSGGQTGTNASVINRHRSSTKVSTLLTDYQTTGTFAASGAMQVGVSGLSTGLCVWESYAYAIKQSPGAKARGTNEVILKTGTKYAFRYTSDAASNAAHYELDWYEES